MKKLLCVFMSVLMIFSSAFVFGASAADSYAAKNPLTDTFSTYDEFVRENKDKEIYGYTYDFLYESTSYVDWTKLDIYYQGVQSTKNSIALAKSDINVYLERVMNNFFLGDKLYTEEYASMLVNFIGKLIIPNFTEKTVSFGSNTTPNEEDFFEIVADESGLTGVIQTNWCDANIEFKNFITAFGVNLNNIVSNKFGDGHVIATELIRASVQKILTSGPVAYIMDLLWTFSKNYLSNLYAPTMALFKLKINGGKNGVGYTVEELQTIEGLLNMVFYNVTDYEFFKFPTVRLVNTSDLTEAQLFLMMYFAINYKYKNNTAAVDGFAAKINNFIGNSTRYKNAGYSADEINAVKANISMMIDCMFKGDITESAVSVLRDLTMENVSEKPNDLLSALMNSIAKIFRKIADYFDYVFKVLTGEIEYGKPY